MRVISDVSLTSYLHQQSFGFESTTRAQGLEPQQRVQGARTCRARECQRDTDLRCRSLASLRDC